MKHITDEIAARARRLIERDGYEHEIVNDGPCYRVLMTDLLEMSVSENGVLRIHRTDTLNVLVEACDGNLLASSDAATLEATLQHLRKIMVLEDLSGV